MKRNIQADVAVVGGGIAGLAAAVGAARAGKKVVLLEKNAYLGGEATHSCVTAYCGFYTCSRQPVKVVGGAGDEMLRELEKLGQDTSYEISSTGNATIKFHPEYMKAAADNLLAKYSVQVFLHCIVIKASVNKNKIEQLTCMDIAGEFVVQAKNYVDASGDASLARMAGAEVVWGNGTGQIQIVSLAMRIDHIAPEADISPQSIETAVLRAEEDGETGLSRTSGVLIRREKVDYGFLFLPSVNLSELNAESMSKAERNMRKQALSYIKVFRKYLNGMEHCTLVSTGPSLGIRESWKIVGRYQLTQKDVLIARKRSDGVGRGAWRPEIHKDIRVSGSYLPIEGNSYYDIPLDMLRSINRENLFAAGRTVSADEVAFASVRVMGTAFVTGQAAGVAAAVQEENGDVDIEKVRLELRRQDAIL